MKNKILCLCAALAALSSGCGESDPPASSQQPDPTAGSTASATEELTSESAAAATSESSTETASAAQTEAASETGSDTMDGTGGDIENEMYKLSGYWESSDREQTLYIENNTFALTQNGETLSGYLTHSDDDPSGRFALTETADGSPDGRYVQRDADRFAGLVFTEDGTDTDFIFAGDLVPGILSTESGTFTYNGIQYTDPITIELTAREDVTDVKLLRIEPVGVDENNVTVFDRETIMELPSLAKGASFTPIVEIPGSIPAYGVSYKDQHGNIQAFSIGLSGRDGSVLLTPFKII